jgi:chromosome segregation ATPase
MFRDWFVRLLGGLSGSEYLEISTKYGVMLDRLQSQYGEQLRLTDRAEARVTELSEELISVKQEREDLLKSYNKLVEKLMELSTSPTPFESEPKQKELRPMSTRMPVQRWLRKLALDDLRSMQEKNNPQIVITETGKKVNAFEGL